MRTASKQVLSLVTGLALLTACSDPVVNPPLSLDAPTAITVATGKICLTNGPTIDGVDTVEFDACAEGITGGIGLVVNEYTDRLAFVDLNQSVPALVNLTTATPGVSHLQVGRLPVDVAASPDGTVAYTLNQIDRDISVVNLWQPIELSERITLSDTPIALDVAPTTGDLVVAMGSPSLLWTRAGVTCENGDSCDTGEDSVRELPLPGTVTDLTVTKDGRVLVVYRDLDFVSVVDLESFTITKTISAGFGCNDGIDNDADGLVDQQDPQCYGPFGGEDVTSPGRALMLDCADGEDNDMDGLIDRNDPDCIAPSAGEDSGYSIVTACNDGVDNDGDGSIDTGDVDCYGPNGLTEDAIVHRGFDAIDIDELDAFAYAVDRARGQVIVFDATREIVVDAGLAADSPTAAFTDSIGIPVFLTPLDVAATVKRDCMNENNEPKRCNSDFFEDFTASTIIVRHSYGAWVSEDTGRLRFVETMDTFCEVPTADVKALQTASFFLDDAAREASAEGKCVAVPSFPLEAADEPFGDCDVECGEDCDADVLARRFVCNEGTGVVVNPRFSFEDVIGSAARVSRGSCDIPTGVAQSMTEFANFAGAPRDFGCNSQLLPQPLQLDATSLDPDDLGDVDDFARADILGYEFARVIRNEDGTISPDTGSRPHDERVIAENWSIEYEGTLPAAQRTDGLFDPETTELDGQTVVRLSVGGLNLCTAGAEPGDLLIVNGAPTEECEGFEGDFDDFRTYEIVQRRSNALWIKLLEGEEGRYSTELPTRECFASGTSYEIRPRDTWVVVGDRSGYSSPFESKGGVCVERLGASQSETPDSSQQIRSSRVKTGEVFVGNYLSFWLFPGPNERDGDTAAITPERGLKFNFDTDSNFTSRSFNTEGVFPSNIDVYQSSGYYRVLSTDSNSNFVFYKDARSLTTLGVRIR